MNEKGYNGWTNYETWLVKLWIDNEQGSQEYWAEAAQDAAKRSVARYDWESDRGAAVHSLSERLKDEHEEQVSTVAGVTGWIADLVGAALSEVNWSEIAESLIEDEVEDDASEGASVEATP
jgi:hypothetical protein